MKPLIIGVSKKGVRSIRAGAFFAVGGRRLIVVTHSQSNCRYNHALAAAAASFLCFIELSGKMKSIILIKFDADLAARLKRVVIRDTVSHK